MSRSSSIVPIAILSLWLVACGGHHSSASTSTPASAQPTEALELPATAVPQPSATPDAALPLDTATGIAPVDHLLRLLAANDFNAVSAEAVFPDKPCTHATTGISGQPACEPGIAEGTLVPAQLFGSCEPNFIGPDSRQLITERLSTIFLQSRI
ncbi:MAG TPA: hypothetical protein VFY10_09825, partial [Dehalococcoidia bacterium]|nr:hypothetical protein [Dehalococcoidia bacterium]